MDIYLDNAASTKIDSKVIKKMKSYFKEIYGNPSSSHKKGRDSRKLIEDSRIKIAEILKVSPDEIYFTSGATEANNMALRGIVFGNINKGKHIITSKIEHPSILETCRELERVGFEVSYIGVNNSGIIDLKELENSIRKDTILISVMYVNNEIGTIQPIDDIIKIAKKHDILFHTDCVQAIGNLKIDAKEMRVDSLSISGHKFYGPKGIGILYLKDGVKFKKYLFGGEQENNKRAGTENVIGIIGIAKALELVTNNMEKNIKKISELREYLIKELKQKFNGIKINEDIISRIPGIISISFKNIDANNLMYELDKNKIYISTGSACNSENLISSHVLKAIGLTENESYSTVRISLGKYNNKKEITIFINKLKKIIEKLREISPMYF